MLKELKRQTYMSRFETISIAGFSFCGALLLMIVFNIVAATGNFTSTINGVEQAVVPDIGGLIYWMIVGLMSVIFIIFTMVTQFNMALSFGAVRKHYVPVLLIRYWAVTYILLEVGRIWYYISKMIANIINLPLDSIFTVPLWVFPLLSLGIVLIGFWAGAIVRAYGKIGFWIIWSIWMFTFVGAGLIGRVLDRFPGNPISAVLGIMAKAIIALPMGAIIGLGVVLVLALLVHGWWITRKTAATDGIF